MPFSALCCFFSCNFPAGWSYHYQLYFLLLSGLHMEKLPWPFLNFLTALIVFFINSTSWLSFMFFYHPTYYREPSKFTRKAVPVLQPYSTQPFLRQTQWVRNTQRLRWNLWVTLNWQKNLVVSTVLNRRTLNDIEGLILLRTLFHSQFPLEVVDLRPWHSRFFPLHVTYFTHQLFWKTTSLSFEVLS